jgi:DNA-binding response OmpR family regulator
MLGYMGTDLGTIVVVEDDTNISDLVDLYLRREGFRVIQASTGEAGLAAIEREHPRMAILDVGLEGPMDGLEVCRRVRASRSLPVLMLTARDGEVDRILGLEMGADDYVTKPFSPRELVARVKAILRRSDGGTQAAARSPRGRGGRAACVKGVPAVAVPRRTAGEGLVTPAVAGRCLGAGLVRRRPHGGRARPPAPQEAR